MKYSVTSVCLPSLSMVEQCKLLQKLGYDGLELRVRRVSDDVRGKAVPSFWGYHVNDVTPENLREMAPELRAILADHGLGIAGLSPNMTCLDEEQVKLMLDGAVAMGAPMMRLSASRGFTGKDGESYQRIFDETVEGFSRCVELCRGSGVKLIIETHNGTIHPSVSAAYRIASQFKSSEVGIIFDPQNMIRDGFETLPLVFDMMGDYLAHCHFGAHRPVAGAMDDTGATQWNWEPCELCEGLFDFRQAMALLKKVDYRGYVTIEDFRSDVQPEPKFRNAIGYLKTLESL